MFSIGEHVIHPGQGVCTVMGFEDGPAPMIVLEAHCGRNTAKLMYPVSQQERLHPCLSRPEAEDLIAHYDQIECDTFTERNSSLEETYFKKQLKHGAPETVRVAKTMRRRINDAEERGKKPSSYYSRVLKEARRRAIEEIAIALEVNEDVAEARMVEAAIGAGEITSLN